MTTERDTTRWSGWIQAALNQRLVVAMAVLMAVGWGMYVAPFDWGEVLEAESGPMAWLGEVEQDRVPVDAIPDLGENQQIVYAEWPGRAPYDVEQQVTYPLSTELQGIPGVETIRSSSMEGFSSIYVIFEEDVDYYWSRARLNEKLSSISAQSLPEGVQPQMGPDATALGQIFWYTLEGRDAEGQRVGGWDDDELRALQDFEISQALMSAGGVSEVGSIGGKVREYQVEVDEDALRAYELTLSDVAAAVGAANEEQGARTTEINRVEYMVRGIGFVAGEEDLASAVIRSEEGTAITVGDVARVTQGPETRRGALTRGGVEAVGGVVTARYGANPQEVIDNVKEAIDDLAPSLPERELEDGTMSKVEIVPFYDRSELIDRTLGTLSTALSQQILITILVILLLMLHVRASVLVSGLLPLAVLMTFVAMKYTGVDANVLALAGIAIAIGTMVDMGIIVTENIAQHLNEEGDERSRMEAIRDGAAEVAPAVVTAITTTVISFLPVFLLTGQEGRLFTPLAFTKTYALVASLVIALIVIPVAASVLMGRRWGARRWMRAGITAALIAAGVGVGSVVDAWLGVAIVVAALSWGAEAVLEHISEGLEERVRTGLSWANKGVGLAALALAMAWLLARSWLPLGASEGHISNMVFVVVAIAGLLTLFWLFRLAYPHLLRVFQRWWMLFLMVPVAIALSGVTIWLGFGQVFGWMPDRVHESDLGQWLHHEVSGLDREFMPDLDEGAFLYMPVTMPHASVGETLEMTQQADLLIESVPEVTESIGKLGRADTPLDPAPVSMLETVINYEPEYKLDAQGQRLRFEIDDDGEFVRDEAGELVEDDGGRPYRNWRDHIEEPRDIWDEIVTATDHIPGLTSASFLQPISTRIVMLQSGIRAPMAVRIQGDDLEAMADAGRQVEELLLDHPMVEHGAVNLDRPVGKPYITIEPDRGELARYGISMSDFQTTMQAAIGGSRVTETVEGRHRFGVRVIYPREKRDRPEAIEAIRLATSDGATVPLGQVAEVGYERGPEMIRGEDAFRVAYVMFDSAGDHGPVDTVLAVEEALEEALAQGDVEFEEGIRHGFVGEYEQNKRMEQRMQMLIPLMLVIIFMLIYLQFRSVWTTLSIFSAIAVAFGGGFIMLWLYGQPWFLDIAVQDTTLREIFRIEGIDVSVAVWVGFIALFGIAADDGIVMATYLDQRFRKAPESLEEIREAVVDAGLRRVRPCLMTTATTILALLPILTSYGAGADVMQPMAVPIVGGMAVALITLFVVPVLYGLGAALRWKLDQRLGGV